MDLSAITACLASTILALLGALHVYWAAGGRRWLEDALPEIEGRKLFRPGPAITLVVAAGLLVMATVIAAAGGWFGPVVPELWARIGAVAIGLVFLGRAIGDFRVVGFFKRVRDSRFAALDTRIYSPLCLVLALLCLLVAF